MTIESNRAAPEIMHIDLNSAFAMTEQQANPLLRGRPVGVTNRLNDYAICITASYEAKALGIGIGTRWHEARTIAPDFAMLESDPDKYTHVHRKMKAIFESYSPNAFMKSVDEGIIDFGGMRHVLKGRRLEDIAREIKQRVKEEVGDYMTVNIGIAQNRWLAKVAAEFHKPDGLLTVNPGEQEALFSLLPLTKLPYIKRRMEQRLNHVGIYTSVDFYHAPYWVLFRQVFGSVNGHHWYLKLRGYETERQYGIRSVGRNYVLEHRTDDVPEISLLFHKATVKISRRLKRNNLAARGLSLSLHYGEPRGGEAYYDHPRRWHGRHMWATPIRRGDQLHRRAMELFGSGP
ncbi:MAG TPA: hypothetical protein VMR98_05040, partial [Candidatus Polarisedimenticolaceae bacterium]|nr:hypothetical protein [Candidatus Polarisedimenticolaceae bacterium]